VGEDAGCGIVTHGGAQDLARMDARPVDGAAKQLLEGEHPMPVVEPDHSEDFIGLRREVHAQELARHVRRRQGLRAAPETAVQLRSSRLQDFVSGGHAIAPVLLLDHERAEIEFRLQHPACVPAVIVRPSFS